MEKYSMFVDWKNQYCQNDYTIQGNLQIQCSPYQITNDIFTGLKQKLSKHVWRRKRPQIAKAILKKTKTKTELEQSDSLISVYTTKLQLSKQYGTGTKIEI